MISMTWYDDACCLQLNGGKTTTWLVISPINYISSARLVKELNFTESRASGKVSWALAGYKACQLKLVRKSSSDEIHFSTLFERVTTSLPLLPARPSLQLDRASGLCFDIIYIMYTHILVYTHTHIYIHCICIIYSIVDIIWFTCHWFWLSAAGICSSLDVMSLIANVCGVLCAHSAQDFATS